jgi:hypothetical protein
MTLTTGGNGVVTVTEGNANGSNGQTVTTTEYIYVTVALSAAFQHKQQFHVSGK